MSPATSGAFFMKKILYFILIGFCAAALTVACKNQKDSTESNPKNIPEGTWTAIAMKGDTLIKADFLRGLPTIVFKDSTSFSGSTGCNQYIASYRLEGNTIKIEMGAMTKMACPGKLEGIYVDVLNSTNKVELVDDIMRFYNTDIELLAFKKSD